MKILTTFLIIAFILFFGLIFFKDIDYSVGYQKIDICEGDNCKG